METHKPEALLLSRTASPMRILVVDDEPVFAKLIRTMLLFDHHQIEIAANAGKALAMFETERHDLVITDYNMPDLDGLQLARTVRALSPAQPIILITGSVEVVQNDIARSNVNVVLGKPFALADLREAVNRFLPAAPSE